jgi:hypothetical protein
MPAVNFLPVSTSEYTEWQRPLSDVYSIIMEKFAQAGEGWGTGCTPTPFTTFTVTYKVAVYALFISEWADTLTLFHLYKYMYSVVSTTAIINKDI